MQFSHSRSTGCKHRSVWTAILLAIQIFPYDKTYESMAFFIFDVVCVRQAQSWCRATAKLVIIG